MRTLFLSAAIAFAASIAAATTITITGGSADIDANGAAQFSIFGTGLSFTGHGLISESPCNVFPTCPAGSSFLVDTLIDSEDRGFSGTVILGGNTFNYEALPGSQTTSALDFRYVLTLPGTPATSTITLMSPFIGNGGFVSPTFNGGQPLILSGQGTATLVLSLVTGIPNTPPAYRLQSAHYEFNAIPEPGTAALILIGFAGLCLWHCRSWPFAAKRTWGSRAAWPGMCWPRLPPIRHTSNEA